MIYGLGEAINKDSSCMKNTKCTKSYLRDLYAEIITGNDGFEKFSLRYIEEADTNNYVNFIDFKVLNLITGEIKTYNSIDTGIDKEEVAYQTEFLNLLDFPGTPLHVLKLKIDVSIILLQNIKPSKLCNCVRLSVKKLINSVNYATILNIKCKGKMYCFHEFQ
ncbi:putative PIF1-like helicase [Hamiltosporidium magnivora]|uniref:Putative PIF1-like helicase n=1 Tax=Hamiltosporidium magnivora TaxID=148818 RepID=A0A4Q9LHI4_9MICR|nr:putative PIF1-like helicase [Hamiltosporidium magnivora]